MSNIPAIPTFIVTGFLGSGKTALLNRMLTDGVKTALIINELGETPIDQDLLDRQDLPMTVLAGGCLCCQIKGTLAPTLKNLWMAWRQTEPKPFERVIIETSGAASPEPILDTLLRDRWIAQRYRLQHVAVTLAVPAALAHIESYPEAKSQLAWADSIWLTHDDLCDDAKLREVEHYLRQWLPGLDIRLARQFGTGQTDRLSSPLLRRLPDGLPGEHAFNSLAWLWPKPVAWAALKPLLARLIVEPELSVVRVKGVVALDEFDAPQIVQAANGLLYPLAPLNGQPPNRAASRLVFIGKGDLRGLIERLADALSIGIDYQPTLLH